MKRSTRKGNELKWKWISKTLQVVRIETGTKILGDHIENAMKQIGTTVSGKNKWEN